MLKYEKHTEIEISDEDLREIVDNAFRFNMGDKERNIRYALSHYRVAKVDDSWDVDQIQLFVDKLDDIVKDIASMVKKKWVKPDIMELSLTPIKTKKIIYPCDDCIHNKDGKNCDWSYLCKECDYQCITYLKLNSLSN